ncbi:MAG: type VII secretion protein EssC [Bacilli bacterium]|nr:type VII secretion protein EssC [Bacilli bacterium]
MRIYLFLNDRLVSFTLPNNRFGSYTFDYNPFEESKLINVENRNGKWVLYATEDVEVYTREQGVKETELLPENYYFLKRYDTTYLIYVVNGFENNFSLYKYSNDHTATIGKGEGCNIQFDCPVINGKVLELVFANDKVCLKKGSGVRVYRNDSMIDNESIYINQGDRINLYGLKFIFFNGCILINKISNVKFDYQQLGFKLGALRQTEEKKDFEVKDIDLYSPEDYFNKSPRFRRLIETKKINLTAPPADQEREEMPLLLTIAPMLTMAISSITMIAQTLTKLLDGTADLYTTWPSLLTAIAMLLSTFLWPRLINKYQKKLEKKKRKEVVEKYKEYLDKKRIELEDEKILQKEIIIENTITVEDCFNNINVGRLNFWSKRIEQNDFLNIRLGIGNELLDVEINYPEEDFTIEQDDLKKEADKLVEEYKYIENVPLGYSFSSCRITGIMGNNHKKYGLMNNIILQLISFYSYDDVKFVILTNEKHAKAWEYMKYLNHTFDNNKEIRFFSTDYESAKRINDYLNLELQQRLPMVEDNKNQITFRPHYIIITDDYSQIKGLSFIKSLVEIDASLGFSFIIMENTLSKLPSKCNNFISLGDTSSSLLRNSYEQQEQQLFKDEIVYNIDMKSVAEKISNIPVAFQEGNKMLPESITFLEMEKVGKVEQLNILDRWHNNDSTQSLKAEVGVDAEGNLMYLDLHEKYHGPHGLIAGMTGSGKSEFIITYILSMAVNYSPDDVAFILIDYKGGGLAFAFENKTSGIVLPHLAGTITNLDKAEMDRTLVSIDSEIKRRQQLFNAARDKLGESTIDIYKYQGFYHEGKLDEPLPHLFIICDEFAELKSQQPDFMDNLISVARIGRSLGVHLILATQKPSGVVNDQIWSNTKFRVCLKVQDTSDSNEMLKRPEAASIKQTGRFYLQVGYDEYFALGQSGWAGAKYYPSEKILKQIDKSINFIDNTGDFIKSIQASSNKKTEAQGEQLAAILNNVIEVAERENKKVKKLWLENVPGTIFFNDLITKYKVTFNRNDVDIIIGEYDAPESQKQGVVHYNLREQGNTLIYGNEGEEREKCINAILYSAVKNYQAEELNVYIVDYGSEVTRMFAEFPQIGGMVFAGDDEKLKNSLELIVKEINYRKKAFISFGGSFEEYNKNNEEKLPQILYIINNYDGLAEIYQDFYENLTSICRDCTRYGVYFIISLNTTSSLSRRTRMCFTNNIAFHFSDASTYSDVFDLRCKVKPRDINGRGLTICDGGIHEFQTFSISDEDHSENDIIKELLKEVKEKNTTTAKKIPELPDRVTLDIIEKDIKDYNAIPIGVYRNSLKTAFIELSNYPIYTISSVRLTNMHPFIESFMTVLKMIPNCSVIFVDVQKQVPNVKNTCINYFDDNIEAVVDKMNKIEEDLRNRNKRFIYVFYGIEKITKKISNTSLMDTLVNHVKNNEHSNMIICDSNKSLKALEDSSWYYKSKNITDGLWIGKGFDDQQVLKINKMTKEMSRSYPNNYGYLDIDSTPELVKLIEFTKIIEEEGEEDEG